MNNEFRTPEGVFDRVAFETLLRPVVFEELETDGTDEKEHQAIYDAFELCVAVAKKRRYYLIARQKKRQQQEEERKKRRTGGKTSSRVKLETLMQSETPPKPAVQDPKPVQSKPAVQDPKPVEVEDLTVDASGDVSGDEVDSGVDSLFASTSSADDDVAVAYKCWDCGTMLASLQHCYPKEDRNKDTILFRCLMCWKKSQKVANMLRDATEARRDEAKAKLESASAAANEAKAKLESASAAAKTKKPSAAAKTKKPSAAAKTKKPSAAAKTKKRKQRKPPAPPPKAKTRTPRDPNDKYEFALHSCVLAEWPGAGFFPAHVFYRYSGNKYHVYFPDDKEVRKGLTNKKIKQVPTPLPNWAKVDRKGFYTSEFKHMSTKDEKAPAGNYVVKKLAPAKENKYICTDVSGKEWSFDIGYVQKILIRNMFPLDSKGKKIFDV